MAASVLLDVHLATDIAVGLQRLGFDAIALPDWHGGIYREAEDRAILLAAQGERRVFVTFDVGSIPDLTHTLAELRSDHSGVILISRKTFAQDEIGPLIRALASFIGEDPDRDFTNQVLFLPRL